ncbi:hypothetical protein MMA231_02512 [Asticcacaulis sp. MM231]|uniref:hypothetical protein n=1 Tax=Asticcacaulis sp. MM231 TaxID=3157666 RepID=UPI0032D59BC4
MSLPTRFTIGQPVEANMTCKYDEWRGVPLWIAGISAKLKTGEITYTVSKSWPPTNIGHLSDPWMEDELCARGPSRTTKHFRIAEIAMLWFWAGITVGFLAAMVAGRAV